MTPRRSTPEKRWIRCFIAAFLAIAAAILFVAQPVAVNAERLVIDVKDGSKVEKMELWYEPGMANVSAIVDGKALKISDLKPFPIELGPHARRIVAIHPGPVIVFEGSTCTCYPVPGGLRCIAYPVGTVCP